MSDTTASAETMSGAVADAPAISGTFVRHGDHVDTIETVDMVFSEQRRLSFTYGAVFFGVTLAVPALSVWAPAWYATPIWGGFTWNYLFVAFVYFVFLWIMAWTYSKQADKLDEKLMSEADKIEKQVLKGGGAS